VPKAQLPHYIGASELDADLLEEMSHMGFDPATVIKSVQSNLFDGTIFSRVSSSGFSPNMSR
jgi:hypothetical protein